MKFRVIIGIGIVSLFYVACIFDPPQTLIKLNLKLAAQKRSANPLKNISSPADYGAMDCYFVSVSGGGITPTTAPSGSNLANSAGDCPALGTLSKFVSKSELLQSGASVQVSAGASRLIQVFGVASNSTGACTGKTTFYDFDNVSPRPSLYEIGRTTADLFVGSSVTIKNSYTASSAEDLISKCTGVSVPGRFSISSASAGNAQITVTWGSSTSASTYTLKRGSSSGSYPTTVSTSATSPFIDTGLTNGTTYYYMVTAVNAAGTTDARAEASATPQDPPGGFSFTRVLGAKTQVTLLWSSSNNATSYTLKRGDASGGPYSTTVSTNATSPYTETGLNTGTYHYIATASGVGGTTDSSEVTGKVGEQWISMTTVGAPTRAQEASSVWTGSNYIVWGGGWGGSTYNNTGGAYDPVVDTWASMTTVGAPSQRSGQTSVWTGSRMIVWGGGNSGDQFNTGGIYDLGTNTWASTNARAAPIGALHPASHWTSYNSMLVWGGGVGGNSQSNAGGFYDPTADSWATITTVTAPTPRAGMVSVWTGTNFVVWGGISGPGTYLNTGGLFDTSSGTWSNTTTYQAPGGRSGSTAAWTGSQMIVWGGKGASQVYNTGAMYDPGANTWASITTIGAPEPRYGHTAVWIASNMIVWGGQDTSAYFNTGGIYNPQANTWMSMTTLGAARRNSVFTSAWTGSHMIVWGGNNSSLGTNATNAGALYVPP